MEDKLKSILELQEQGKNRTEIWRTLGYTKCSSLTRYMESKGYKYNEIEGKYIQLEQEQKEEDNIQQLKDENNKLRMENNELNIKVANQICKNMDLKKELEEIQRKLEIAQHFNDENNINRVVERANKKDKEIEQLKSEIQQLKDEIHKLKNENDTYSKIVKNERGAGRKERLTVTEKESIKMYRMQGKTIKELAEMYNCSIGLIHKIVNS